jgi:hypothetical protein
MEVCDADYVNPVFPARQPAAPASSTFYRVYVDSVVDCQVFATRRSEHSRVAQLGLMSNMNDPINAELGSGFLQSSHNANLVEMR